MKLRLPIKLQDDVLVKAQDMTGHGKRTYFLNVLNINGKR
jgi:hypothetical protein